MSGVNTRAQNILAAACLVMALGALLSQRMAVGARRAWLKNPAPLARPLPERLTRFSLVAALAGQERIASDWAYIDALQYLGDKRNVYDANFVKTLALYDEVLWLDPRFEFAYLEGAAVLGWHLDRPEKAEALLRRALVYAPDLERAKLYLAALAYQKAQNPQGVLDSLRSELMRSDVSDMLLRMVGNLILRYGDPADARRYWAGVQQRAKEPFTQSMAAETLRQLSRGEMPGRKKGGR